jgi:TonB family protein
LEKQPAQNPRQAFLDIHHAPEPADPKARLAAGILTSVLYVVFAVLIWGSFLTVPVRPPPPEIFAQLLPDAAAKKPVPPTAPPHLVRPRAVTVVPPDFKIASAAPAAPALLPATAAATSPMAGGSPTGTGTGRGAAGQGPPAIGGDGNAQAGCLDLAWFHAVTMRVMPFVNYPWTARRLHTTGVVILHFVVHRTGLLEVLEVSRSSGSQVLDDAAFKAMSLAQPLPPIPDRMHTDRVDENYEVTFGAEPIAAKRLMAVCPGPY